MGWKVCDTCKGYGRVKAFLWFKKKCPDCLGDGGFVTIDQPKVPAPVPKKEVPVQSYRHEPTMSNYSPSRAIAQSLPTCNPYYGQKGGNIASQSRSTRSTSTSRPSHYSSGVTSSSSYNNNHHVERETVYVNNSTYYPTTESHHHIHNNNDCDDSHRHSHHSHNDDCGSNSWSNSYDSDSGGSSGGDSGGCGGDD